MKQFWRNIFFIDRPAQGAFFALWLLMLGSYAGWSIYLLLAGSGLLRPLGDSMYWGNISLCADLRFLAIETMIMIAFVWLTVRFYLWFALRHFGSWTVGASVVIVLALLCGFLYGYSKNMAYWGCPALLFGIFPLIFAIVCRQRKMAVWALLSGVMLSFGIWGVGFARWHLSYVGSDLPGGKWIDSMMDHWLTRTLGWQYWHWQWFLAAVIFALVVGGIGYGKILTMAAGIPFQKLWSKALGILIGLTVGVYVLGWVAVTSADRRLEREKLSLEQFFGKPLSIANWTRQYYLDQPPDAGYWGKLVLLQRHVTDTVFRFSADLQMPPPAMAAPDYDRIAKGMDQCRNEIDELTQMLQSAPPKRPAAEQPLEIGQHLSVLMLWQINVAAKRGDAVTAHRAFVALTNLVDFFHQKYVFDSRWVLWQFAIYYERGVELMLENNLLSSRECTEIIDHLHRYERQSASWQNVLLYREYLDILTDFKIVDAQPETLPDQHIISCLELSQTRWLMPSLGYYFGNDLADFIAAGKNISKVKTTADWPSLGQYLQKRAQWAIDLSDWLARLRTLEGIIRVKQFQQKNGYYPAAMPDLPLDPFSNRPLRYQLSRYETVVFCEDKHEPMEISFPIIKVWSVGRNRKDDNGFSYVRSNDDICSMIRVNGEKKP